MSGPPFQRLEELFHRALALPESERAVFLDRECAGEAILRAALEDLLRHDAPSETDRLMVSPIKRTTTPIIQAGSTTEKGLGDAWNAQTASAWAAAYKTLSGFMIREAYGSTEAAE